MHVRFYSGLSAQRPLKLVKLCEAQVINLNRKPPVSNEYRLSDAYAILDVLPGLISISGTNHFGTVAPDTGDEENGIASNENADTGTPRRGKSNSEDTEQVTLAHSSVKEYLTGSHIFSRPRMTFMNTTIDSNQLMPEVCLAYILNYNGAFLRTNTSADLQNFLLLDYACRYWHIHSRSWCFQDHLTADDHDLSIDTVLLKFLSSDSALKTWLQVNYDSCDKPLARERRDRLSFHPAWSAVQQAVKVLAARCAELNTKGEGRQRLVRAAAFWDLENMSTYHCRHIVGRRQY